MKDVIELIALRPSLPPTYMARLLKQNPNELEVRLEVATKLGWLEEQQACCGQQSRFRITNVGRSILS